MIIGELIDKGQNHRSPNYDFSTSASAQLARIERTWNGCLFHPKKGGAALRKGARCFFGFFPEGWLLKYQASTKRTQFFRRVL